jgi:putative hydrolase of the HAD superfamily
MTARPKRDAPARVIVFDLDDTLYLERDYVASGFRAVGRWAEDHLGCAEFGQCCERHFAAGVRGRIFDAALDELGLRDETLISRLIKIYRDHPPEIGLAPDAAAFLECLGPDTAVALLTDGFLSAQLNKIRALGLGPPAVWPIVCTDQWGRTHWKPHERGFLHIQQHHGLPPAAFTYVADNPSKDFIAPRRLGWHTIQIKRPERLHADVIAAEGGDAAEMIESLDELMVDIRPSQAPPPLAS